jgi:uncharacterized protein (TIGR03083 family)
MDDTDFLAALERDGREFVRSCERAPDKARIEACPEWTAADLLRHLTGVHWFFRRVVELRAQSPKDVGEPERPSDEDLPRVYSEGLEQLLAALRAADPATPVWTLSKQHRNVAWIIRRQAQETAIHRWDADQAAKGRGREPVLEPHLASDGVDEFLETFVNRKSDGATLDGTVHIHCTDVTGEWLVKPEADGLVTTREHAKGDVALRGTASDLDLVLWRRKPLTALEIIGDRSVAEQFVAYAKL